MLQSHVSTAGKGNVSEHLLVRHKLKHFCKETLFVLFFSVPVYQDNILRSLLQKRFSEESITSKTNCKTKMSCINQ